MTPEAQQTVIAETCGYKWSTRKHDVGWKKPDGTCGGPPDYLNDLNACHDLENWLEYKCTEWYGQEGESATEAYMNHLQDITGNDDWMFMGASAAQRCHAFLLTVGKWNPSQ